MEKTENPHPGWNEDIYVTHFEIENLETIVAGSVHQSEEAEFGPEKLQIGVKATEIEGVVYVGVYLYKVSYSNQLL
jgi:hypothetical protein